MILKFIFYLIMIATSLNELLNSNDTKVYQLDIIDYIARECKWKSQNFH